MDLPIGRAIDGLVAPADLLLELGVLDLDRPVLAGAPEDRDQLVVGERLLDVVEGAGVDRADRALQRGLGGHEDDRRHRVLLPGGGEDVEAGDLRHAHVGEDDVVGSRPDLLQPGLAALGGGDLESLVAEQDPQGIENPRLVIDDQHRRLLSSCSVLRDHLGGQENGERGAGPGSRVDQHQSAMRLDGALNDGQTEPAAAGPAGDERLEQPLADLLRDPGPLSRT